MLESVVGVFLSLFSGLKSIPFGRELTVFITRMDIDEHTISEPSSAKPACPSALKPVYRPLFS